MRIIDLSPRVSHEAPVWPGDEPFSLAPRWSIDSGDAVTVGTVTTTTHIGAHIDAPAHIVGGAPSIEATPLDACVGRCLIIEGKGRGRAGGGRHGSPAADYASEDAAVRALSAEGFKAARILAERDGLRFAEAVKPNA